jgi:hypothetical protein
VPQLLSRNMFSCIHLLLSNCYQLWAVLLQLVSASHNLHLLKPVALPADDGTGLRHRVWLASWLQKVRRQQTKWMSRQSRLR